MQQAKRFQDNLCKILKARAKIEKVYADSLTKWHQTVDKETKSLNIYPHEKVFIEMVLSRDFRVSRSCHALSSHIVEIADVLNKKSDIFFGQMKYGQLENIKDLSSKFKVIFI